MLAKELCQVIDQSLNFYDDGPSFLQSAREDWVSFELLKLQVNLRCVNFLKEQCYRVIHAQNSRKSWGATNKGSSAKTT